jgi:hypothetical protein
LSWKKIANTGLEQDLAPERGHAQTQFLKRCKLHHSRYGSAYTYNMNPQHTGASASKLESAPSHETRSTQQRGAKISSHIPPYTQRAPIVKT